MDHSEPTLIPQWLTNIIHDTYQMGGTHCHVVPGQPVLVRRMGIAIKRLGAIPEDEIARFAEIHKYPLNNTVTCDRSGDWRAAIRITRSSYIGSVEQEKRQRIVLQIRILPHTPPDTESLGLGVVRKALFGINKGLILVGGPNLSGRTTTLTSLLMAFARARQPDNVSVATLDKHIEYVLPGTVLSGRAGDPAQIVQYEVGKATDEKVWYELLEDLLLGDYDMVSVGDLLLHRGRDEKTLEYLAMIASQRLVLATATGLSYAELFTNILGPQELWGKTIPLLAHQLRAIVLQQLIQTKRHGQPDQILPVTGAITLVPGNEQSAALQTMLDTPPYNIGKISRVFTMLGDMKTGGNVPLSDAVARLSPQARSGLLLRV